MSLGFFTRPISEACDFVLKFFFHTKALTNAKSDALVNEPFELSLKYIFLCVCVYVCMCVCVYVLCNEKSQNC
jgi:hypothetical protein